MSLLWVKGSISNNRQSGGYNTAKWINLLIMLLGSNVEDLDPEFEIWDPMLFRPLDPGTGSRMGKNPDPGSRKDIQDHIS